MDLCFSHVQKATAAWWWQIIIYLSKTYLPIKKFLKVPTILAFYESSISAQTRGCCMLA